MSTWFDRSALLPQVSPRALPLGLALGLCSGLLLCPPVAAGPVRAMGPEFVTLSPGVSEDWQALGVPVATGPGGPDPGLGDRATADRLTRAMPEPMLATSLAAHLATDAFLAMGLPGAFGDVSPLSAPPSRRADGPADSGKPVGSGPSEPWRPARPDGPLLSLGLCGIGLLLGWRLTRRRAAP